MPSNKTTTLRCPTCRKLVLRTDPEFPFCSERCRLIDLGKWASGGYVISSPVTDPDAFGDAERPFDNAEQSFGNAEDSNDALQRPRPSHHSSKKHRQ